MERRPIGWSRNPSLFSFRAKAALLAALASIGCLALRDLIYIPLVLPLEFLAAGALSLLGSNSRWRETPWLVFLNMLLAVATLFTSVWFGIVLPALTMTSPFALGWAVSCVAAALAGVIADEWLASAQTLRRLGFYGRRIRRSFFGLSPRRHS